MGETCEVCGREKVVCGTPNQYLLETVERIYGSGPPVGTCYRLGYERSQAALAAARAALNEIVDATDDDIAEKIARKALASPAAGEEGKHG